MEHGGNKFSTQLFDGIQDELLLRIGKAKRALMIAVTWFTDHALFDAILHQMATSLELEVHLIVLNDKINNRPDRGIKFQSLIQPGRGFFYYSSEENLVHHKFCIIDGETVVTGSYNWTNKARTNRENIVIIEDSNVAAEYAKEFTRITEGQLVHDVEASKRMDEPFNAESFIQDDDFAFNTFNQKQAGLIMSLLETKDWSSSPLKESPSNPVPQRTLNPVQSKDILPFDLGIKTKNGFYPTISVIMESNLDFEGNFWMQWNNPDCCSITIQRRNVQGIKDVEIINLLPTKPVLDARNDFSVKMRLDKEQGLISTIIERICSNERPRYRSWKISDYATR